MALRFTDELANDARGLAILQEWLGDGCVPVSQVRANDRALICLECPENRKATWWETAKEAIAYAIKRHMEIKNKLKVNVAVEEDIGMCRKCGCCLRLKVHVPIDHIAHHISEDEVKKFPAYCWMRQEIELL